MSVHFLAIHHESYDSTTVFGVFDDFLEARAHVEAQASFPYATTAARFAEIEEWDGPTLVATHERTYRTPTLWMTTRHGKGAA